MCPVPLTEQDQLTLVDLGVQLVLVVLGVYSFYRCSEGGQTAELIACPGLRFYGYSDSMRSRSASLSGCTLWALGDISVPDVEPTRFIAHPPIHAPGSAPRAAWKAASRLSGTARVGLVISNSNRLTSCPNSVSHA